MLIYIKVVKVILNASSSAASASLDNCIILPTLLYCMAPKSPQPISTIYSNTRDYTSKIGLDCATWDKKHHSS